MFIQNYTVHGVIAMLMILGFYRLITEYNLELNSIHVELLLLSVGFINNFYIPL